MSIWHGQFCLLNRTEMIIFFGCHHKSGYLFRYCLGSDLAGSRSYQVWRISLSDSIIWPAWSRTWRAVYCMTPAAVMGLSSR